MVVPPTVIKASFEIQFSFSLQLSSDQSSQTFADISNNWEVSFHAYEFEQVWPQQLKIMCASCKSITLAK